MATFRAIPEQLVPLHISGNMSELQNRQLRDLLTEAILDGYQIAIEQLDNQSAATVLAMHRKLKAEISDRLVEIVLRYTVSDKFKGEEVSSDRVYPPTYRTRPVEAQVSELRRLFPGLGSCSERLARKPLPAGAEAWFAVPRWQKVAPTYNQAVERMLDVVATRRKLSNRIVGKIGELHLRETERAKRAKDMIGEQQEGHDFLVLAAQLGMLHRGSSARRTRMIMAGNEFGLGVFAIGCILLTHPERLSSGETLMIDCSGDEYSARGDCSFDRVPLFDYDAAGIELSIFYDDRAFNLWGTPTAFLVKPA